LELAVLIGLNHWKCLVRKDVSYSLQGGGRRRMERLWAGRVQQIGEEIFSLYISFHRFHAVVPFSHFLFK
jgi:hypothetical protein